MTTSSFKAGALVRIDRRMYTLMRMISQRRWQLEDCNTREIHERSHEDLQLLYKNRSLHFIKESGQLEAYVSKRILEDIPEEAKIRRAYVHATLDLPCTISVVREAIRIFSKKMKSTDSLPDPVTVIRWRKRYLESGRNIMSLVSKKEKRGNRQPRFQEGVFRIVDDAIESKYLTQQRRTITDTFDHARVMIKDENRLLPPQLQLEIPSRGFVSSRIARIPAYDRYAARHGKTAADMKFRAVLGHRITKAPLERAEIDHTPLDLFVVDDETFVPLGRPYLTSCIDDFSRSILGIHIGFQPPSYQSVARCLKHAFMPKVDLKDEYPSLKNQWHQHGVMRELVVDNGAEFHSGALELACGTLGIEVTVQPL